jgi:uncharacterized protein YsxB (DUF464 family)
MITITKEGYKITVEGHAGYAPHGHDIVCSAVSSLFCAMSGGLSAHEELFEESPSVYTKPGFAIFECAPKPKSKAKVDLVWDIFESSFVALSLQYPEYVSFCKK